jgi:hypothetical protein
MTYTRARVARVTRVTRGVIDRQTTITTAAPHARERASERAPSQRAARACVRGGGTENGDDARDAR